MYADIKTLPISNFIAVEEVMNSNFYPILPTDPLRTIIKAYAETKLITLPVVDSEGNLIGVFPRGSLYKALLDGKSIDDPCSDYIVYSPKVNYLDITYDIPSMLNKITNTKVISVPVIDQSNKVVGMLEGLDYFRKTINLIAESLAFLNSIFQGICEGMIVTDNAGRILMINHAIVKMFGLSDIDVKDKLIGEVFPEIVFSKIDFKNKSEIGFRCNIRSLSLIVRAVPIIKKNEQIGVNLVLLDISFLENIAQELESTKELQATLAGVLNASADGVFVTTKAGVIKYVNEKASQLLRNAQENIVGHPLSEFITTNSPTHVSQNGLAEVDVCHINNKPFIISQIPISSVGVVSTVYSSENKLTGDIARKWFSLRQQVRYYKHELEKRNVDNGSFDEIVSKNDHFVSLKEEAKRIARSTSTVLLTGESGVGKDMFARAIHSASPRAKHPFIKVNCAAIPETLLESELFGYASGSFTGASKKGKPGYFEQANNGTIFLDEIGDMPLSIQVKILQVLQDKQFMRVGGTSTEKVDVRIIAATNRDLIEAISNGTFREDLYYRLNVIELNLPPLRERPEDILPLAEMFIQKYNQILGSRIIEITKEAKEALVFYRWPGNIRELENAIERAANYAWEGEIGLNHLPTQIFSSDLENRQTASYKSAINDVDKELIVNALKVSSGNKSAAARLLKISRSTFYEKLKKYGLM
jgi:PAS domain S-box-containing protein